MTRVLWDLAGSIANVSISHIKGHDGHPWNTFADKLALGTSRGDLIPPSFPCELLDVTLHSREREWE
eukprot:5503201-Pyramimonas_sp.AAC.1